MAATLGVSDDRSMSVTSQVTYALSRILIGNALTCPRRPMEDVALLADATAGSLSALAAVR
jgi:hypothetical protein